MTGLPLQSTDPTIAAISRAFVVYDPRTGEVLGVHHVVSFPNSFPAREDAAARALRLAKVEPGVTANVLEVDPAEVNVREEIEVDPVRRAIVRKGPRPRPARSRA